MTENRPHDNKVSEEKYRAMGRDYYLQVSESIKSVFDLTSRVDERVQLMMKKQEQLEKKLDEQYKSNNETDTRVTLLEAKTGEGELESLEELMDGLKTRVHSLEIAQGAASNRWSVIATFGVQIIWVVLAAWILLKLGIQAPAVP